MSICDFDKYRIDLVSEEKSLPDYQNQQMEDDFSNNDLRKEGIDSKSDLDKSKTGKNTSKVVYFILNSM